MRNDHSFSFILRVGQFAPFLKVTKDCPCHELVIREVVVELGCDSGPYLSVELEEDGEAVVLLQHFHRNCRGYAGIATWDLDVSETANASLVLGEDPCLPYLGNTLSCYHY